LAHNTQSSLAGHFDNVGTLEGVIAEHNATKHGIGVLRELLEKAVAMKGSGDNVDRRNREEEEFGSASPR